MSNRCGKCTREGIVWLILLLLVASIAVGCSSSSGSSSSPPSPAGPPVGTVSFEGGALYQTSGEGGSGTFNVLVLNGDWHQMGRQYGYLLKDRMGEFYDLATTYLITTSGRTSYDELKQLGQYGYDMGFDYIRQLIDGMTETSGFSAEKQKIVAMLMGGLFGCSSMDAWGDYTPNGLPVVGRNWDTGRGTFDGYGRFLTVVVYNPPSPQHSVVDINYVGSLSMQTGINDAGIFLDLQNGQMSDPNVYDDRKPGAFQLFSFLLNAGNADELNTLFLTTPDSLGLIINTEIGSPPGGYNSASVYEWATYNVKRRTGTGLLASTNHYVDPSWTGLPPVPDGLTGAFTKERLQNLLNRGEQYKGSIDANRMKQIFNTTIPAGGPTFPYDSPYETYYQIVAAPAERTIWLKARGYSGWERIALSPLFSQGTASH